MWEWHFWLFCAPSEVYMCDEVSSYLKVLIKRYWIFFLFFFFFFFFFGFISSLLLSETPQKAMTLSNWKWSVVGGEYKESATYMSSVRINDFRYIWWYGKRELTKISFSREVRNEWPKTNCPTKWVEQTIEIYKVFYLNFCLHFKPH